MQVLRRCAEFVRRLRQRLLYIRSQQLSSYFRGEPVDEEGITGRPRRSRPPKHELAYELVVVRTWDAARLVGWKRRRALILDAES